MNKIKKIVKWLGTTKVLSVPRRYAGRILVDYYKSKGMMLISIDPRSPGVRDYYQSEGYVLISIDSRSPGILDLIRQIKKETDMLLSDLDAYQIYTAVKKTEKIEGNIAEVGIYKGGSAKLICEATKKPIHLFDTFEGLPNLCEHDDPEEFQKGDYSASLESVKSYLRNYSNVSFYKGFFPSTAEPVKSKIFSFVHLDVDIYESTLNCLKFFYPRMAGGGY